MVIRSKMIFLPCSSPSLLNVQLASDLAEVTDAVGETVSVLPESYRELTPNIELALTETLNNAVIHGNQSRPNKQVWLSVVCVSGCLEIRVRDEGARLSQRHLDEAKMPEGPAESGRGLALIKALVPEARIDEGGQLLLRWSL